MNRREPAARAIRAKPEWSWLYVGLAVFMLCRLALLGSASLLASNGMSAEGRAHQAECRVDDIPRSAPELGVLPGETPDEDPTSDLRIVVSRLGFEQTPYRRVGVGNAVIPTHDGHLLVSTGLGRGPPIG